MPPCPASSLSWCRVIVRAFISSFSGIHILSSYPINPSFHLHHPNATPFISLSLLFSAFFISCNFVSFLVYSCNSCCHSLSSVVIVTIMFISSLKYLSLGSRTCRLCVFLLSSGVGRSAFLLVKASGFPPCFPGQYSMLRLNWLRFSLHLICRPFSSLVVVNGMRFLWSVRILTW